MTGPLEGIRVVEFCGGAPTAQAGQVLADFGADVVGVEPPGGSPLRAHPVYAMWGRGKRSVVLDLGDECDRAVALRLVDGADVVLEGFRPDVAERLGVGYEELARRNPRLVHAAITGWGRSSPYAGVAGYEALVMAKLGVFHSYGRMSSRPGPSFISTPYAAYSATQTALTGVLAALYERETSGLGQRVETDLALAAAGLDPWNQMLHMLTERFPDAFQNKPTYDENLVPSMSLTIRLLVAVTSDGHWLQFSQVQPRLFLALVEEAGLAWMLEDPEWSTLPEFEDPDHRRRFIEKLMEAIRQKSLAEWQEVFDRNPNVFAEVFRQGTELLHHPQLVHAGQRVGLTDPERGDTLQPAPAVWMSGTPTGVRGPAPLLDADGERLRATAAATSPAAGPPSGPPPSGLPLEGLIILELGTFYAGPYGATVLTDLGARVVKVEPLDGDPMRMLVAFPEAGAAKVLQGKESIAVDIGSPEGQEVVRELASRSHVVLCSFRAGVAERLGVDAASLLRLNPELMYLDAPGYGTDGPYGHRPAFAPTISAGSGIAMRNFGPPLAPERSMAMSIGDARLSSVFLSVGANSGGTQPDGLAALTVGTALALAAFVRARGGGGQRMLTTMLLSAAHALSETVVEFAEPVERPQVDQEAYGYGALYRLYETAEGWVFLAAPTEADWCRLAAAVGEASLAGDPRFRDAESRAAHEDELAEVLATAFHARGARQWEKELIAAGVGCVVSEEQPMEAMYLGAFGQQAGMVVETGSPIFDTYPRIGPLVGFSRSRTRALGGCTLGEHTVPILEEIGWSPDRIAGLRDKGVIGR
ncbi:CaiB/BaiF CoA transferase family protein [Pseudonocardia kunmingensis]|uniref:Dimethylsulfoniopropionate cleavage enzyme DddD n=1 Tax=Pseudonocardia kunmingensis TaxID=630975 RepID=A0A543DPK1_9PSEU|nr:CoA transferase [Pseudonocardia kunmingensis]TQM11225.1 dimethylsulfoniopropionate cleavage enzyme DddD [Pseudonocardia kunmingensis]